MREKITFLKHNSKRNRFISSFDRLIMLSCFLLIASLLSAQVTPPNANSDAECGGDCFDLFNWGPVQDGSGTNIPNYGEGISQEAPCNTVIESTVEYDGNDPNGIDVTGIFLGANLQGTTAWTDTWTLGFDTPLTNPIVDINSLFSDSEVCITDCNGTPISLTDISTGTVYASGCFMGNDEVQLSGTFDCFILTVSNDRNDAYTFSVGTCLGLDPLPPCLDCGIDESYKYLTLVNSTGSGTGATADVNLNGVLYGTAEVLFSDLDINEDLSGSKFGAFDSDGGVFLLRIDLCEPITVQQVDILGLETESQAWVGDGLSGSGMTGIPTGFTLSQCGGPGTMAPTGNMVTNTASSCLNQGSGKYTVGGATTSTLYFRYTNPTGGCVFDKATFRIGACVPELVDAVPVCPLSLLTITDDVDGYLAAILAGGDGSAFTTQVTQDANGNYFNQNCTQIQNEVESATAIPQAAISPCSEVVDEDDCFFCDPPPPCVDCPVDSEYSLINLAGGSDVDGDGLDEGEVYLNGVCIGAFDVVYSDLDVREDVSGTKFGGLDNDGGVYVLQLDFCDPLTIQQLDIRGLEVQSQVSVGTTITGTPGPGAPALLGGLDLTWCDGSTRMLPEDPPVNQVITDGPGCFANPNASYTLGGASVSTLYFQYHNPAGGCSFDYVGFRIGTCYTPPPMAAPVCPVEIVTVTCDMEEVIADGGPNAGNSDQYAIDGNGNYFDFQNCGANTLQDAVVNGTLLQTVDLGCADLVETNEECVIADCEITPTCTATACPANTTFDYINLDATGTNAAGLPMGVVELDNVKIGTYEFLFSDLDNSNDGNGTTFGGWDTDGGTMLLELSFCEPLNIQEIDIRGLEVESQVSVGTATSTMGADAVLSGQTLQFCAGSDRMTLNDGAPNLVITDGPGCLANPDATYTVGTNPITTLYFKYHNPVGGCRGDYVGFKVGVCAPEDPGMAVPLCPLNLYAVDDCPDDPNSPILNYIQDVNGNWFIQNNCPTVIDTVTMEQIVRLSPCATTTFVEECTACCSFEVTCPTNTDLGTFDCTQLTTIPAAPTSLAAVSAAPYNVVVGNNPCGDIIVMSSDDAIADVCTTGGQTITRTVTIFDDENGNGTYDAATEEAPVVCTFTFEITEDTTVPTVLCDPQDEIHECDGLVGNEAAANAWNAQQIADLTNCSSDICGGIMVTSDYNFGNLSNDCGFTGTMTVTFTIEDDCGDNTVTKTAMFTVIDTTNPFACDPVDATHECNGLAGNIAAAMAWNDANMAALMACSNDDCGSVVVTNDFDFNNLSDECGLTGNTIVTYTITDECSNFVTRNATFTVEDNTAPTITCPAGITLSCFETIPTPAMTPADFVALGGTIDDICTPNLDDFTVFSQDADNGGDNCPGNARVVVRTYFVNDNCGNTTTCEQTFTYLPSTQGPVITSILPSCFKYCTSLANPMESDITYDTDCSFGATVSITGPTNIGQENCPGSISRYTYTVTDDCGRTSAPVTRDFIVQNDGPTIECPSFNLFLECGDPNNSDYMAAHAGLVSANSSCDADVTISYFPQNVNNITCNSSTTVTFVATDACGRTASCTTIVNVSDNTAPEMTSVYEDGICNEAVCGSNLNFWYNNWKNKVMEGLSATDACDTNVSITAQGPNSPSQNCPDETTETVVNFVATDNCGNTSYIPYSFYVTALETPEPPQTSSITGLVHTESMEAVEDVEVYLSGGANFFEMFVTGNDGMYAFDNVPLEQNYTITPLHNQFPMNGVSSYDLVLIAQHILGVNQLDSPYKMIAADINNSGSITTLDLVELRKMILMINSEFSNNTSWRFVDADFVFPNATNPFATSFPEVVDINGLLESAEHDFVGVKIGDVNESAVPNNLTGADDRSFNGNLNFNIDNQLMEAGEIYEVVFRSDDFKSINGYQYTLNFDPELLDFIGLTPGDLEGMSEANFGLSLLEEGAITTSWTSNSATDMDVASELFTLTFKAKRSIQLSEALLLNSRFTAAEAYGLNENDGQLSLLNIGLRFENLKEQDLAFSLKQNTPNPFRDETLIGFILPEATNATLTIYDVSGKLLKAIEGDYEAGYNEISLSRNDLSEGVLYYELVIPNHSATMKMLLLNK